MANATYFSCLICIIYVALVASTAGKANENSYYYQHWCGQGALEYLDDQKCQKFFPSSFTRDWRCDMGDDLQPEQIKSLLDAGFVEDGKPLSDIKVDVDKLSSIVTSGANLCLIVSKRSGSTIYNKYFCAGERSASEAFETWSSSKIFAMANAASHLRINESTCGPSPTIFGDDGFTNGKHGKTALGDLATIICSYDHTAGYTSNSLSSFFHDIGWRSRINSLINSPWLGVQTPGQTLGGNYGEASPPDLSLNVLDSKSTQTCQADKDPWTTIYSNTISSLTAAELTRRIAMHRDIPPSIRFPGMEWQDAQNILMGAESSLLFSNVQWGGMSTDTAIFLQQSLGNMTAIDEASRGTWRIFSKLGAGYSSSRSVGEIVSNAYACLPNIGMGGQGKVDGTGFEFTINVRGSQPNDSSLLKAQEQVFVAMKQAVEALIAGKLF